MDDRKELEKLHKHISARVRDKETQLHTARIYNDQFNSVKVKYDKTKALYNDIKMLEKLYSIYVKFLTNEDHNFKQRRLEYLEKYIDSNLDIIFPNECFKSHIEFDYSYNSQKVSLTLIDREGKVRIPSICEGSLLQQLIGFSAAVAITECLGSNKFYMDEAFSASSMENKSKIADLLKKLVQDSGFQIILIEQSDDIYKDIPRREIYLNKDEITAEVSVVKTIDY